MNKLTLDMLSVGESGVVKELISKGSMKRRMTDLGIVNGTRIECVGRSPAGDPCAYLLRGAVIAIRSGDAKEIILLGEEG